MSAPLDRCIILDGVYVDVEPALRALGIQDGIMTSHVHEARGVWLRGMGLSGPLVKACLDAYREPLPPLTYSHNGYLHIWQPHTPQDDVSDTSAHGPP